MLKDRVIRKPKLRNDAIIKPFILMTDASGYAFGAVLDQQSDGKKDQVIVSASRGFKRHQKNYATIEKEAFVIV